MSSDDSREQPTPSQPALTPASGVRCVLGGILMGLANLVPGISGGTMLLAIGIYRNVIEAIADLASFRSLVRSGLVLVLVVVPAVLAIVALSGEAGRFVLEYRWVAYSLFIGLTFGGVPVLLRTIGRIEPMGWLGCFAGLIAMALLAYSEGDPASLGGAGGPLILFVAGLAAGAAMLLPGLSGSYVLLVLGQYVVVLSAVEEARASLLDGAWGALAASFWTIVPVALGVIAGIAIVGLLVRWFLHSFRQATLGALLGLLIGAVFGLWPFRVPVPPEVGALVRGIPIESIEAAELVKPSHWPTIGFTPSSGQIAGACALVLLGAVISGAIGLLGREAETLGPSREGSSSESRI